jgi:hypothetical protein
VQEGDCVANSILIHSEHEVAGGWTFVAEVGSAAGAAPPCSLKLSFADYNLWCASGSCSPADVARAVVEFMLNQGAALPRSLDASTARRRFRHADEVIPTLIRS